MNKQELSGTLCKTGPRISDRKKVFPQTLPSELPSVASKWKAFSLWKNLKVIFLEPIIVKAAKRLIFSVARASNCIS